MLSGSPATFQYAHPEAPTAFNATLRPSGECEVCRAQLLASATSWDPRLGGICPTCAQSAAWFDRRFDHQVQRQREEYAAQLPQLIRDRAAGATDLEFHYRDEAA